jgi:uncharacterized membrane protein YgaE (UPF0421/DUF939 family)
MKIPWLTDWWAKRKLNNLLAKRKKLRQKPIERPTRQYKIAQEFIENCTDCGGKQLVGVTSTNRSEKAIRTLTDDSTDLKHLEDLKREIDPFEDNLAELRDFVKKIEANLQEADHKGIQQKET